MANLARFRRRDREAVFPRNPHRRRGERRDPATGGISGSKTSQPYLSIALARGMDPGVRRDDVPRGCRSVVVQHCYAPSTKQTIG
jgi:hypothetical protein